MGGSGGSFFPQYRPDEFQRKVREAEGQSRDEVFEAEANELIAAYLADFNNRDAAAINEVLERVKAELTDHFEGTVDLRFGGSVAKHTYVDGLSDIDALMLLEPDLAEELSPAQIRERCAARLREIFGRENVSVGQLAVTVKAGAHEIQLLPALRTGDHFKIGSANGTDWERIKPRVFAAALTDANGRLGNKLVPTIKLAKAAIAQLPDQKKLSGYHVEALALRIFDGYSGELAPRVMVRHFFEKVSQRLLQPITDVTGQSDHVDDYLGEANSIQRQIVADACGRIGRRMANADLAKSRALWQQIFGDGVIQ